MIKMLIAAAVLATPAMAQDKPAPDSPPKRVRSVLLFGDDPCPKTTDPDEIVVCATAGDSPYRIPKRFRDQPKEGPTGQAWTRRMEVVEEVSRSGLPNSCSPVGIGGQTGCTRQMIQQWAQDKLDREAKARAQTSTPDDN
ncbi:hypothetical protein ACG3SL_06170 [Sphingomonas sp. CJ20]